MAGGAGPIRSKLKEKKQAKVIGQEYRAKKAGGDVKKKGRADPYPYVPLTIAAKGTQGRTEPDQQEQGRQAQEWQAWTEVVRDCRRYFDHVIHIRILHTAPHTAFKESSRTGSGRF
ncbi:MAG: hypothetical protein J3Q66DRAFT_340197, partial [Benniella sp.]